ncbi:unnamed protein product [Adineta steineri]|uniref:Uncharacterized protein n=2 Tax=Adineta steineri TaxID=433720 RepID=A0A813YIV7_9BILA|nr:unnamed protein product [Adineta steineri]CAF3852198.1 unnamed protein product [Adineta steineri]
MFDFIHFWSFTLFTIYKEFYFYPIQHTHENIQSLQLINELRNRTRWFPGIVGSLILIIIAIIRKQLALDRIFELIALCSIVICSSGKYRLYFVLLIAMISLGFEIIEHNNDCKLIAILHAQTMFMLHIYLTSVRMDVWWLFLRTRTRSEILRAKRFFHLLYEARTNSSIIVFFFAQQALVFYVWHIDIVKSYLIFSFTWSIIITYNMAIVWNYFFCKNPNYLVLIPFLKNEFPDDHPLWGQLVTILHLTLVISLFVILLVL